MADDARIPVYFDFASTLCYVAHRVMATMVHDLDALGIELCWSPVDLTRITGWRRGADVPEPRRHNAERVARELAVPVTVPRVWPDSRAANASLLLVEGAGGGRDAAWRERLWTALFEEHRNLDAPEQVAQLAARAGFSFAPEDLTRAAEELERRTLQAAAEEVTGVPTFMLDQWAFGGIQSPETMRSIFERWVQRRTRRTG
jgi:predicted DsbA family dithiol-disulfide isomerase